MCIPVHTFVYIYNIHVLYIDIHFNMCTYHRLAYSYDLRAWECLAVGTLRQLFAFNTRSLMLVTKCFIPNAIEPKRIPSEIISKPQSTGHLANFAASGLSQATDK